MNLVEVVKQHCKELSTYGQLLGKAQHIAEMGLKHTALKFGHDGFTMYDGFPKRIREQSSAGESKMKVHAWVRVWN